MNVKLTRNWLALPLIGAAALTLAACSSGPTTGDVEGQVLAMRSATEQPALLQGAGILIAGNGIDCGKRADRCFANSDATGKYAFKDVPAGNYAIAFNPPASGDAKLQEETRQFNVSGNSVETVSVVLLAEGMARPQVPPELAQQRPQSSGGGGFGSPGLTSNPFFWYWVFNQPWVGGYSRPPVVVVSPDRTVTVDRSQPTSSTTGRPYSSYSPTGGQGTKPAPQVVESKGVTRPGSAALPGSGTGTNPALGDSSRGVTRPGQAPAASSSSSSSSGSVRQPAPAPPRVGAGGGSTAGRTAPPRVRVGRR